MTHRWDKLFAKLSLEHASMSKDPDTRVGSQLVGSDKETLCGGFNGFPRGIADDSVRLYNKDLKLRLMVHAERNVLLTAARRGIVTKGCTLYLACTDDTGLVWGGPPCVACSIEIIQAGIVEVVSYPQKTNSRWYDDLLLAKSLLMEAGIHYREIPYER